MRGLRSPAPGLWRGRRRRWRRGGGDGGARGDHGGMGGGLLAEERPWRWAGIRSRGRLRERRRGRCWSEGKKGHRCPLPGSRASGRPGASSCAGASYVSRGPVQRRRRRGWRRRRVPRRRVVPVPAARSTSTLRWRRGRGAALSSQTTLGPPASPGALALVAPVALGPLGAPERPPKMSKTPGRRGDVETRRMPGASRMPGTEGPTYAK